MSVYKVYYNDVYRFPFVGISESEVLIKLESVHGFESKNIKLEKI